MKTLMALVITMFLILLVSSCSPVQTATQAQNTNGQPPQWWEVVGGIVAIPVAVAGLFYTFFLIKKTNLESRLFQLEIVEKQNQFGNKNVDEGEKVHFVETVLMENQLVFNMILRFILLYLIYNVWGFVSSGFDLLVSALSGPLYWAVTGSSSSTVVVIVPLLVNLLNFLPVIGRLLIFLGLGWPLFKDVNKILGIDLKAVFRSVFRRDANQVR